MDWKLDVVADRKGMGTRAADLVIAQMEADPASVLALPTGRTPLPVYQRLVNANREGRVSFSRAHIFQLDEFYPIAPNHPASFRRFLERELEKEIDVDPARMHFFDGQAADPEAACERIEAQIAAVGGLDFALLGIGDNAHVAFNEPGTPFDVPTHVAELDSETREAVAYLFSSDEEIPCHALTMGLATIMGARRVVLIASGSRKAEAVREALEGPISPETPASVLRRHEDFLVVLDPEAAALLSPETIRRDSARS